MSADPAQAQAPALAPTLSLPLRLLGCCCCQPCFSCSCADRRLVRQLLLRVGSTRLLHFDAVTANHERPCLGAHSPGNEKRSRISATTNNDAKQTQASKNVASRCSICASVAETGRTWLSDGRYAHNPTRQHGKLRCRDAGSGRAFVCSLLHCGCCSLRSQKYSSRSIFELLFQSSAVNELVG